MRTATEICRLSSDPDGLGHLKFASHLAKVLTANSLQNRLGVTLNLILKSTLFMQDSMGGLSILSCHRKRLAVSEGNWSPKDLRQVFYKDAYSKAIYDISSKGEELLYEQKRSGVRIPVCCKKRLVFHKDTNSKRNILHKRRIALAALNRILSKVLTAYVSSEAESSQKTMVGKESYQAPCLYDP